VFARQFDQREVACVQAAHGRNERDMLIIVTPLGDVIGKFLLAVYD
jgi:hypothetical protein